METRIQWIDQLKGFTILLVVYGHLFPISEKYIYSFHIPLFFIIAGLFHPEKASLKNIKKRFSGLIFPYFGWSLLLFFFWSLIGRNYGESANLKLSVFKNFLGVFYAQGGTEFMDWGMSMWFLPALFLCFFTFYLIQKIKNKTLIVGTLLTTLLIGFIYPYFINFHLIWSLDIVFVMLLFYAFGYYTKEIIINTNKTYSWLLILFLGILHFITCQLNSTIDIYRSEFGKEYLLLFNGLIGSLFFILAIKKLTVLSWLSIIGKITIPILALHMICLSFIKLFLMAFLNMTVFNFTEFEKIIISVIQIILIIPIGFLVNRYVPILNGGVKKLE